MAKLSIDNDWLEMKRAEIAQMALADYVGRECRICGRLIEATDLSSLKMAGQSADGLGIAVAHGRCWVGFLDTLSDVPAQKLAEWRGDERGENDHDTRETSR